MPPDHCFGAAPLTVFFTADTHFGDAHILRQRGRRFASLAEHDETLVANWNAMVGPEDEVWHLGDFALGSSDSRIAAILAQATAQTSYRNP